MLAYFMSNLLVIKFKYIVFFLFMDIFVIGLRAQELKVKLLRNCFWSSEVGFWSRKFAIWWSFEIQLRKISQEFFSSEMLKHEANQLSFHYKKNGLLRRSKTATKAQKSAAKGPFDLLRRVLLRRAVLSVLQCRYK